MNVYLIRWNLITCAILMFACGSLFLPRQALCQEDIVSVYGATLLQSNAFQQAMHKAHAKPVHIDSLHDLDSSPSRLLILAGDEALPDSSHEEVSRFLQHGGNVIVVGTRNFYGAPQPINEIPLGNLLEKKTYAVIEPDGGKGNAEDPLVQSTKDPDGKPALRLSTSRRDMINIRFQFDTSTVRSAKRTILTFTAKGDAYMDLMFLEAVDSAGQKYFSFVPLSHQWQKYAISLADFIPEKWSDPLKPYPLIDPAQIATVALGTNRSTLWQEKPMDWSLGQVNLAEEKNSVYAPSAALARLSVPFKEIGIAAPQWIFDPFYGSQASSSISFVAANDPKSTFTTTSNACVCPPAYTDFPGTKMGTDNKKEYDTRQAHSMRREVLIKTSDNMQDVAESRLFTGDIYAGADVVLFGFTPQQIVNEPKLVAALFQAVGDILHRPRLARVEINTTAQQENETIFPVLTITAKNPLSHEVKADITVNIGSGQVQGKASINLPPHALSTQKIQLAEVPQNFNFAHFQWQIALKSEAGSDLWQDTVDADALCCRPLFTW